MNTLSQYSYILVSDANQNINPNYEAYYGAYYSKSLFLSGFSPNYEMNGHISWLLAGTLQNIRMPTNYSFKNLEYNVEAQPFYKYSIDPFVGSC